MMLLELKRIGWTMIKFDEFQAPGGSQWGLTGHSPNAIHQAMIKGHHQKMYQDLAADHGRAGADITLEPIKRAAGSKKLGPKERGLVRAFAAGSLWTNSRSRAAGYDVPITCQLCNNGSEDTLRHRLYECRHEEVLKERGKIRNTFFLERAADEDSQLLYLQGVVTVPAR